MESNFTTTFVSTSQNGVLAESIDFSILLTQVVNETTPQNTDELSTFSGIWIRLLNVESSKLFKNESKYTSFYRSQTNISVTVGQNIFQIKILEQTKMIFHDLLFPMVVLELFELLFLIIKLLLMLIFWKSTLYTHLQCLLTKKKRASLNNIRLLQSLKTIIH